MIFEVGPGISTTCDGPVEAVQRPLRKMVERELDGRQELGVQLSPGTVQSCAFLPTSQKPLPEEAEQDAEHHTSKPDPLV
jgi:hypothetical protein